MIFTEKSAVKFIVTNLSDLSINQYFAQDMFKEFMDLISQGKEIAAAEQYKKVTGCSIEDCHFAASIARRLSV